MLDMHCHEVYMIVLSREHVGRFLKLIPSDHTQDGQIQVYKYNRSLSMRTVW